MANTLYYNQGDVAAETFSYLNNKPHLRGYGLPNEVVMRDVIYGRSYLKSSKGSGQEGSVVRDVVIDISVYI
ncbi:hypothetical protein J6590_072571 [Homalodisca vitripennis]|nr:hypothetical protein J6590_072571 [Homalodisca vitripennis]